MSFYSTHAQRLAPMYDAIPFERIHAPLLSWLPYPPASVLDVGAGSGRDAAWFAAKGYEVVAVEPVPEMMEYARAAHPHPNIRWISDSLPALSKVIATGLQFDLIHLSAVFMHLPKPDRDRAFRKLTLLLNPGGRIHITLRDGPSEPERGLHHVPDSELEALAREHGAFIEFTTTTPDSLDRPEVSWRHVLLRLPDDGLGAMPLLRSIILNDDKSSTYKLALLRTVGRIANDSMAVSRPVPGGDKVEVPLGLVALYWIRAFIPLLKRHFPQSPINRNGVEGLAFAKQEFIALMSMMSEKDLRIGTPIASAVAPVLHRALKLAAGVITKMPAHYTTYASGETVFEAEFSSRVNLQPTVISVEYLASFGVLRIPEPLWLAFQRFNVWIDPTLTAEWVRMMVGYASQQGRVLALADLHLALEWADPVRDVSVARHRAVELLQSQKAIHCVWTGKKITLDRLDMDHCIPWSAWPCGDLWNLMPADRKVNQSVKREKLPSAERIREASERILEWWEVGYESVDSLRTRFWQEAGTTLPGANASTSDLIDAIQMQRMRIHRIQLPREW